MFGMVIAHYVWPDESGHPIDLLARAVSGRAMPLFVMLGGLGVTLLTARAANPDRALIIRAAMLFPLGVVLQEATTVIAIILQSYGVFFLLAVVLRRLPTSVLGGLAAAVTAVGAWTYQVPAEDFERWRDWTQLYEDPTTVLASLVISGPYPVFPVLAFFLVGMIVGRLNLRSEVTASRLAIGGTAVGFGTITLSYIAGAVFNLDRRLFDIRDGSFAWDRLADFGGHSEMPAWVISASGTSLAVLGLGLLIAPGIPDLVKPPVALGRLALTFYAFQAVLIRFTPEPPTTPFGQELLTVFAIYFGFMVFAVSWTAWLPAGPLEWVLRLGSSRKRPLPSTAKPVPLAEHHATGRR